MNVLIYTKPNCPFCVKAKQWMQDKNVQYKEINVSEEEKFINMQKKIPGAKTVPQIFVNDKLIGGYDDLIAKQEEVINLLNN